MVVNIDKIARQVSLLIMVVMFYVTDFGNIKEVAGFAGWFTTSFYTWIFYIDSLTGGGK